MRLQQWKTNGWQPSVSTSLPARRAIRAFAGKHQVHLFTGHRDHAGEFQSHAGA